MHFPWKSKNRGCKYLDLFRRRRRWRCWKSQGKLVYWMKRGSKYWRFCLVRSFCINQPQVSYYPRWHAGSGTRRGGTLRKKAFFQSILIVLSSITIIIKADHFQALALNSSPFSNPKSQSPPPQAKEPSVVAFRGGLGAPVTQGARGWLYNGTHHPQPTKHLTQLHTREGGADRFKSLKNWGPVLSFLPILAKHFQQFNFLTFSQGAVVFSWFHLLYISILVLYMLFVLFLFIHFPILS